MFTVRVYTDPFEATLASWQKDAVAAERTIVREVLVDAVRLGADHARELHRFQNRSHDLEDSIRGVMVGEWEGIIEATAPYASEVEEGTPEHTIEPKEKLVLHWTDEDGEEHFARIVEHPGTKAMPFIQPAASAAGRWAKGEIQRKLTSRLRRIVVGLSF